MTISELWAHGMYSPASACIRRSPELAVSPSIPLKNGDLVIRGGSEKNIYIHSMKIDGQEYDSTWIDWERLENGAVIEYRTSSRPDRKWGTEVTPPSYS